MAIISLKKTKIRKFGDIKLDQANESNRELIDLFEVCQKNLPNPDYSLLMKAYNWCLAAHENQLRKSGHPYYTHPLQMAMIIAGQIPFDDTTVACALLHDILDYSDKYSLKDLRDEFGEVIAEILDGISKIGHIEERGLEDNFQIENYQKLLFALFKDIRVIIVKLADRLHNMQTIEYLPEDKQQQFARETLDIYCSFAQRIGLGNIKWELEDLSFKALNRDAYEEIKNMLQATLEEREEYIKSFVEEVKAKLKKDDLLKKLNILSEVSGRPKHIYSIYNKLKIRGLSFEELNDLFAIRIILDTDMQNICFYVFGLVCEVFKPVPGTFKNYIYTPKLNGYQSIHTAVIGPKDKNVEVQIRTRLMHDVAERGVAAHFKYKGAPIIGEGIFKDQKVQEWMDSLHDIFENLGDESPAELVESVRKNLFQEEIFVFTPKRELRKLPKDSTPLDFAYLIHSEIGNHCLSAKVNGKIVPLDYKLQNGDIIQIISSEKAEPDTSWLRSVATSKAKVTIIKYLKEKEKKLEDSGRKSWQEKIEELGIRIPPDIFEGLCKSLNYNDSSAFFIAVASGQLDLDKEFDYIVYRLREYHRSDTPPVQREQAAQNPERAENPRVNHGIGSGLGHVLPMVIAKCCHPLPGDRIIGMIDESNEIIVHRRDCGQFRSMIGQHNLNLVDVDWSMIQSQEFEAELRIIADYREDILNDVTSAIIESEDTGIRGISFETKNDVFISQVAVSIAGLDHLHMLVSKLLKVEGIKSVERKV